MSENVHGHQMPPKGINVNPDNPVFGRHQPEVAPAEIAQGLHGAPSLRSEFAGFTGDGTDASPAAPVDPTSAADVDAAQRAAQAGPADPALENSANSSITEHEDTPENVPDLPESDTGASDPEVAAGE